VLQLQTEVLLLLCAHRIQHQTIPTVLTYISSHPDNPAGWPVKLLEHWDEMGRLGGVVGRPCWATAGRRAAVWILSIPGPQRQDVCFGYAASDTGGVVGGIESC